MVYNFFAIYTNIIQKKNKIKQKLYKMNRQTEKRKIEIKTKWYIFVKNGYNVITGNDVVWYEMAQKNGQNHITNLA